MNGSNPQIGLDRRGSTALKTALVLPALLMAAAGAFDLVQVQQARAQLQTIADDAARVGAEGLTPAPRGVDPRERSRARVASDLEQWDKAPSVTATYDLVEVEGKPAVRVQLKGHRPSLLGNLLPPGGWTFDARSTAIAPAGPRPQA